MPGPARSGTLHSYVNWSPGAIDEPVPVSCASAEWAVSQDEVIATRGNAHRNAIDEPSASTEWAVCHTDEVVGTRGKAHRNATESPAGIVLQEGAAFYGPFSQTLVLTFENGTHSHSHRHVQATS